MPKVQCLKTLKKYFQPLLEGKKTFELRKNDRNFEEGDELHLWEIDDQGEETGRGIVKTVTYVLHGPVYGLAEGWVILGIGEAE